MGRAAGFAACQHDYERDVIMTKITFDPFEVTGKPSEWGAFGTSPDDEICDAERRAICDYFIRRWKRAERRNIDDPSHVILSGSAVGFAGLFVASKGGPDQIREGDFEAWLSVMTFAWYQAINCGTSPI